MRVMRSFLGSCTLIMLGRYLIDYILDIGIQNVLQFLVRWRKMDTLYYLLL